MRVLIFEDEPLTAERLVRLLEKSKGKFEVLAILESVKQGVEWLSTNDTPDLIFMDIQLSDGSSFEIFEQHTIEAPVIFTTAYDQYAIQAFKVNSVDYLLKPIDKAELENAIKKFEKLNMGKSPDKQMYTSLLQQITQAYKQRFMVRVGEQYKYVETNEVAYFVHEEGATFAYSSTGKRYILDQTIEQIEQLVDPKRFFRINRKFIVGLPAIGQMHRYFNSRIKLKLDPDFTDDVIVSRDRASDFKSWIDQ